MGFAFCMKIKYGRITAYCSLCNCVGHNLSNCIRKISMEDKHDMYKAPNGDMGKCLLQTWGKGNKKTNTKEVVNPNKPKISYTILVDLTKNKNHYFGQTSGVTKPVKAQPQTLVQSQNNSAKKSEVDFDFPRVSTLNKYLYVIDEENTSSRQSSFEES